MNKNIGIALIIFFLGIGFVVFSSNKKDVQNMVEEVEVVKDEVSTIEAQAPEKMIEKGNLEEQNKTAKIGSYEAYGPEKIVLAATGDVVLFFHASWCPTCRGLSADIEKNAANIPDGLTILKTDYDRETELKKKYGVTVQHTLVQVDKNGNMIKKWSGGSKLENLVSQLQ